MLVERDPTRSDCLLRRGGSWRAVKAFRVIEAERACFPVSMLCKALEVSKSGYYAWKSRSSSRRIREAEALIERIREIHERSRQTYGYPGVHAELCTLGMRCGRCRVARLMPKAGIRGCRRE
jgi:putative transposase